MYEVEVGRTRMSATIDEWFQFASRMKLYGLMDRTKYIHDKHTAHIRGLKIKKNQKKKKRTMGNRGNQPKAGTEITTDKSPAQKC